jgi:hypothetical protein
VISLVLAGSFFIFLRNPAITPLPRINGLRPFIFDLSRKRRDEKTSILFARLPKSLLINLLLLTFILEQNVFFLGKSLENVAFKGESGSKHQRS